MLYKISVWIHLIAATIWVGGMLFLVLVLFPLLRKSNKKDNQQLIYKIGKRFRRIGWISLFILFISGISNIYFSFGLNFGEIFISEFGNILQLKLTVFLLIVIVSFTHDFATGPLIRKSKGKKREKWRKITRYLGLANLFLGLLIIFLGVVLVRGGITINPYI